MNLVKRYAEYFLTIADLKNNYNEIFDKSKQFAFKFSIRCMRVLKKPIFPVYSLGLLWNKYENGINQGVRRLVRFFKERGYIWLE